MKKRLVDVSKYFQIEKSEREHEGFVDIEYVLDEALKNLKGRTRVLNARKYFIFP